MGTSDPNLLTRIMMVMLLKLPLQSQDRTGTYDSDRVHCPIAESGGAQAPLGIQIPPPWLVACARFYFEPPATQRLLRVKRTGLSCPRLRGNDTQRTRMSSQRGLEREKEKTRAWQSETSLNQVSQSTRAESHEVD